MSLSNLYYADVLAAPLACGGTLVVMVPSKKGLVVAADSRTVVLGTTCDCQFKILIPTRPDRTIATVTGNGTQLKTPSEAITDVCRYIQTAPRLLDIEKLVTQYLEDNSPDIKALRIEDLAQRCVNAVKTFHVAWPFALKPFAGHELFRVVLANYNPNLKVAHIRNFFVALSTALEPHFGGTTNREISYQDQRDYMAFGETDYLNHHVRRGIGRKFLSPETVAFLTEQRSVAEIERQDAVAVAMNVIEATSKTSTCVPAPSGIGGPVDVVILGDEACAQKLHWKIVNATTPSSPPGS